MADGSRMAQQPGSPRHPGDTTPPLVPLDETSLGAAMQEVASRRGTAPALVWEQDDGLTSLSYEQLSSRARAVAEGLLEFLAPGDRLGVWSANTPNWIVAEIGAALAGVVLVPLNPALTAREAAYLLSSSGAGAVLAGDPWRDRDLLANATAVTADLPSRPAVLPLERWCDQLGEPTGGALPRVEPGDALRIQYTSGTTGTPKGVLITHFMGVNIGPISFRGLGLDSTDVVCAPLPFHHVGGSICQSLGALLTGATYVLLPQFEPKSALRLIERTGTTFFGGVPTMVVAMLEACNGMPGDLPRLRSMMLGGSDVSPALITEVEAAFEVEVFNGYGQSESPSALQTRPGDSARVKAQTIGRANEHHEIRIVDPATGMTAPPETVGELCIRSRLNMAGYWEEHATGSSSAIDDDGWLYTGDLASIDEEENVTLRGRLRDVIIRGGENLYPAEVEAVLAGHPSVAEIAVVAGPDPRWGQVPVAFVRPTGDSIDPDALEAYAREHLASFKVPRTWRQVPEFPLTASGKIQKFQLAAQLQDDAGTTTGN